jgi:hypothetical protein
MLCGGARAHVSSLTTSYVQRIVVSLKSASLNFPTLASTARTGWGAVEG